MLLDGSIMGMEGKNFMPLFCELDSLQTESDVEQKFIYPFLNSDLPIGLGYSDSEILTKHMLRRAQIDKGAKRHYYYPDYVVSLRGLPVLVVEAKVPSEKLSDGFYEARLYALELNAAFSHGFNTCKYVMATNGKETWIGYADQGEPFFKLCYSDFNVQNVSYSQCVENICRSSLIKHIDALYKEKRGDIKYVSPVGKLGGKRVQNSEMEENAFGRILVFENRGIFDPNTEDERESIVENAYITSVKREQHMDPIYKEIKKFEFPASDELIKISTDEPSELVESLKRKVIDREDEYSLMLVVGNVGSGKTTFTRYFRHVYLKNNHAELESRCEWIFLNMNSAPMTKDEIYNWIKAHTIETIIRAHSDVDIESLEIIKVIFHKEIRKFEKGLGALISEDKGKYNDELYKILRHKIDDKDAYLSALIQYIKEHFSRIPIIVMDNCDKRNKDEQLLMFEVAQWMRTQFKCIVLLPMRDTTYDQYKSEPPLDTIVRDLVFRIDPPDLLKVLQARLDYLIRITDVNSYTYILKNGAQVSVKKSELNEYFKCILVAIRKDRWISDIFYRLSNRNIRNGIQIFEDFCKSGHMTPDDIFAMRVLEDDAEIPTYKFENVLLRKNRRYYNSNESNFISVFSSDYNDDYPDPLVRLDMLWWLSCMNSKNGPTNEKGVFPISSLLRNMQLFGHNSKVVMRELDFMIRKELIVCDNVGPIREDDRVKIALPGILHMTMLKHISYIGACAEDFLFKNTDTLTRITNRLRQLEEDPFLIQVLDANDLVEYLLENKTDFSIASSFVNENDEIIEPYNLDELYNAVKTYIQYEPRIEEAVKRQKKYNSGMIVKCRIVNKKDNGIVCSIEPDNYKGFLSTLEKKYGLSSNIYESVNVDEVIQCSIIEYDFKHNSFQLKYAFGTRETIGSSSSVP